MKKLKTLTTSTAIALASVGGTAFAQEATTTTAVDATAVNEPTLVSKPVADAKPEVKKSSDVKPALDAQASTVKQVEAESQTAKAEATSANKAVTTTETALTSAKEDLKSAEAVKANATEENITATKAKQDANVQAQEANQKATEASTEAIKAQTETVATETANVASATSKKAEADKTVTAKEANVKSAEDALNGSGLGEAKASLAQAEKDIEQANANISSATTAVETAKKADSNRAEAIKQATNNVNVKNDALKLAKEMMDADQNKVDSIQEKADATASKEKEAQTALDAEKAKLNKSEGMNIPNPTFTIPSNVYNGFSADVLKSAGVSSNVVTFGQLLKLEKANKNNAIKYDLDDLILTSVADITKKSNANVKYDNADQNRPVDIDNLTDAQKLEISEFYVNGLKQIRNAFKDSFNVQSETGTTKEAVTLASTQAEKYEKRGLDPMVHGHVPNAVENVASMRSDISNMYELKQAVYNNLMFTTYLDGVSNADKRHPWGHLYANLNFAKYVGIDVANINGRHYMITAFSNEGTPVSKSNELAQLEAKLAEAQKQNSQAQTALTNAKAELASASRKYASALEAKTDAEKELASKTASPIQTEVAEKNLQLANLALKNAQERKATAEKAVENFSRSQAEKQTALETAKAELATAKTAQKDAETALTSAQAKLQAEENKLTALQAEQAKLHAEKDQLVSDAKAIATELSAYLNADKNLADAQAKVADLEAKLAQAKSTAKLAQDKLDAITTKLKAEQAKLAEIQEEFDKLLDLENKAKENVVATLPDGTVVAVDSNSNTLPTENTEKNVDKTKTASQSGKDVALDDKEDVVVKDKEQTKDKQQTYSAPDVKSGADEKVTYSRVERAKSLPDTGESSSVAMLVLGAILGVFGLVTVRRKN
ncbi:MULTISPECIES: SEC10/PgrA surface exclusion domain-containing protein [Streptococcus]|uniref:SEC10/PgrA surface exclusion domain-containing protein n=1 Tax=Streptococcus sp. UMB0029 TaxID=2069308 RepID=UPI0015E0902B|nr:MULTISPECIES: SEC10/PgrA surface exclusion domain-containing protein [Streptococcus]MDK7322502.1 SEC10/PgrA surface exclusion domain-containing protein [Streptococcus mitis]